MKNTIPIIISVFFVLSLFSSSITFAQGSLQPNSNQQKPVGTYQPLSDSGIIPNNINPKEGITELISAILFFLIRIGIVLAFIMILTGGFMYIFGASMSNQGAIQKGKSFIINALLGLLLLMISVVIINRIGINISSLDTSIKDIPKTPGTQPAGPPKPPNI